MAEPNSAPRKTRTARPTPVQAAVVFNPDAAAFDLLAAALDQANFWRQLAQACRRAKCPPAEFQILIKPDLNFFEKGAATGTDPALVEHLVDLLHDRGYTHVTLGDSRASVDVWLENRDVLVLADLVGYQFVTPKGRAYDLVDLGEDLVEAAFPPGSALAGTSLARAWVEANFRISFAKNKTDEGFYYALTLHNLLGALPLRDKDYHYHHRHTPQEVVVCLLRQTPLHFSLIDAVVSSHGSAGSRLERPLVTQTIIAGGDPLLVDWVAALKMGLDPFASPLNGAALRQIGLPVHHTITGDQTRYPGWENVHPLLAGSMQSRSQWLEVERLLQPWLQQVNRELFPFKDLLNDQVNAFVLRYLGKLDDNPLAWWGMTGLNYSLGALANGVTAYRTLYDKTGLRWQEAPLNVDPAAFSPADFDAVVSSLQPLDDLIRQTPPAVNGLRWRYLDKSILFEFSKVLPIPFEAFVARVDISQSIQMMNDYIGGSAVAVEHDELGRVTRQVERNLYLPQPNFLVLFDGKMIDVTKLELIQYTPTEQRNYWKTIKSENGSAEFDDGLVIFSKTTTGETHISVMGRQEFNLPLFWQVFNLDANPPLKGYLVDQAYNTFFLHTLANFEARYEGRPVRIGRPWHAQEGEPSANSAEAEIWPVQNLTGILEKVSAAVGPNIGAVAANWAWPARPSGVPDENGFVHFKAAAEAAGSAPAQGAAALPPQWLAVLADFLTGLVGAVEKDWGYRRPESE